MNENETQPEPVLTGPHNAMAEEALDQEQIEETEIKELNDAIDVATDLSSWSKTPAGKDTIERLQNESHKAMNELFAVLHDGPELGRLVSIVARFEASVQMLRRFIGAEQDLDTLLKELIRRKGQ